MNTCEEMRGHANYGMMIVMLLAVTSLALAWYVATTWVLILPYYFLIALIPSGLFVTVGPFFFSGGEET